MTNKTPCTFIALKIIALHIISIASTATFAQSHQDLKRNVELQNIVQLSANASVDVSQDILSINMSTMREGADANTVQTQLKNAIDVALSEAKKMSSVGQLDVRTGNFSLYPRYGRDGKLNGWQGTTELILEGRDFSKISSVAGKIQSLTIAHVAFSLSREQRIKAESEAQHIAIERFRTKAVDIAKSFGMNTYALRDVSVNTGDQGYSPRPRAMAMEMKMAAADSAVPVEAGKSTVLVTVSGSVQLK